MTAGMDYPPSPPRLPHRLSTSSLGVGVSALTTPQLPHQPATSPGQQRIASFRNLVNREGYLPHDRQRWPSREVSVGASPTSAGGKAALVDLVGLDRGGRVQLEGVFLNNVCSLRKFQLVNLSQDDKVVVRLGSTLGDQLRWQLRNDNLDHLRKSNDTKYSPFPPQNGCDTITYLDKELTYRFRACCCSRC